jgi:prophage regulatory protein
MNPKIIIRFPALKRKTGASRSFIYASMKKDLFPKSISIGPRAIGWLESEIDDWIDARINVSRGVDR